MSRRVRAEVITLGGGQKLVTVERLHYEPWLEDGVLTWWWEPTGHARFAQVPIVAPDECLPCIDRDQKWGLGPIPSHNHPGGD